MSIPIVMLVVNFCSLHRRKITHNYLNPTEKQWDCHRRDPEIDMIARENAIGYVAGRQLQGLFSGALSQRRNPIW